MARRKTIVKEDILSTSMTELMMFFLFFSMILLGSYFDLNGGRDGCRELKSRSLPSVTDSEAEKRCKDVSLGPPVGPVPPDPVGPGLPNDLPVTVILDEDGGYKFASGRATLTPDFLAEFNATGKDRIIALINSIPDISAIEIIGHADEQKIKAFDGLTVEKCVLFDESNLRNFHSDPSPISAGICDNAALGLARAVETAKLVRSELGDRLRIGATNEIRLLPMSAGNMHLPNGSITPLFGFGAKDIMERRRIEIRVRTALR